MKNKQELEEEKLQDSLIEQTQLTLQLEYSTNNVKTSNNSYLTLPTQINVPF